MEEPSSGTSTWDTVNTDSDSKTISHTTSSNGGPSTGELDLSDPDQTETWSSLSNTMETTGTPTATPLLPDHSEDQEVFKPSDGSEDTR